MLISKNVDELRWQSCRKTELHTLHVFDVSLNPEKKSQHQGTIRSGYKNNITRCRKSAELNVVIGNVIRSKEAELCSESNATLEYELISISFAD